MVQLSDLKQGMYLNNSGQTSIPVYDDFDTTKDPILTIAPGEMIGQIVDFKNSNAGAAVLFSSDAISSALPLSEKVWYYLNPFIWGTGYKRTGVVNFVDLQNNVSDSQVASQNNALANSATNGVSFGNAFKEVTTDITSSLGESIPWVPITLIFVALNWKTFFKPVNIKK